MTEPTTAELAALACDDCVPRVTIQQGRSIAGLVLVVCVTHPDSCPWAARNVPPGGAVLVQPNAILKHVRESDEQA